MKAVMYHYVCSRNEDLPELKYLHIDDFKKQLDFFEEHFGFVSLNDFLESFKTGIVPKGVLLTFDDGLKCHYEHVFPELQKRGLFGIFYVATRPLAERKFLDVHKIHILLARHDSNLVYNELQILLKDNLNEGLRSQFDAFVYADEKSDVYTIEVKKILNYFIDFQINENIVDRLLEVFMPDYLNYLDDYYLTTDELKKLHEGGMIIGCHTVSHPVMSKLCDDDQLTEISHSFNYLEEILHGLSVKTFCYPFGGDESFSERTEEILKSNDFVFSFSVENRDINKDDLMFRPQSLPRYDCNQFAFGSCR